MSLQSSKYALACHFGRVNSSLLLTFRADVLKITHGGAQQGEEGTLPGLEGGMTTAIETVVKVHVCVEAVSRLMFWVTSN